MHGNMNMKKQNVLRSSCKVPDSSVRWYQISILSEDFHASSNIKFHKNPSLASRPDRQTDMTKLIGTFRYYCTRLYMTDIMLVVSNLAL